MGSKKIHEFRNDFEHADRGLQRRWANVLEHNDGSYTIECFINQIHAGNRIIKGHSEQYAEDAAENFVLGLYDNP